LVPHLEINAAVPYRLFHIAAGLCIQSRQPTVGREKSWKHAEGCLKRQSGAFAMAESCQGDSEMEMAQRQEMLQANRQQSLLGSLLISALPQPDHGQPQVRFWTVSIDLKRALECALRLFGPPLAKVSFTDAQMQIGQAWVRLFRFQQAS
jgi:hypothetical protein